MENVNQQEQEQELTPEQLTERKEQMLNFYKESIPYLEAQLNYENLLTSIDEVRFKRTNIQYNFAMMMNQQQEEESEDNKGADFDVDKRKAATPQVKKTLKKE